jgi:tryptophanyl-tRNA synthetase
MSKSSKVDFTRINLLDPPDLIEAKIAKAKTDSTFEVYSAESRPELTNLMTVYAALKGRNLADVNLEFKGLTIVHFKAALVEVLVSQLAPIRERADYLLANPDQLKRGLQLAKERARATAAQTLSEVKQAVGFVS